MPPPRRHRHRYHGVLAPMPHCANRSVSGLDGPFLRRVCRYLFQPRRKPRPKSLTKKRPTPGRVSRSRSGPCCWPGSTRCFPLSAPTVVVRCVSSLLLPRRGRLGTYCAHLGEPEQAPTCSPARDLLQLELAMDQSTDHDLAAAEPIPEYDLDQTVVW